MFLRPSCWAMLLTVFIAYPYSKYVNCQPHFMLCTTFFVLQGGINARNAKNDPRNREETEPNHVGRKCR